MAPKLDELTHYAKLLSKISHKKYEYYVISRIIHLLNDTEIQFTTQQVVRREDGGRYLIDLFFPQFNLAVEVDEGYHNNQIDADKHREQEVVDAANVIFRRIKCDGNASLESVHEAIDDIVKELKRRKETTEGFEPYSYENEFSVDKWLEKGVISVKDHAKFRTHADVLRLFGKDFKLHQSGTSALKNGQQVWFPKLYNNKDWKNSLSSDGKTIRQYRIGSNMAVKGEIKDSLVFAHQTDVLGNTYYVFKGVFTCTKCATEEIIYQKIADSITLADYL